MLVTGAKGTEVFEDKVGDHWVVALQSGTKE